MNLFILQALNILAELLHLTYQVGVLTRQYVVPAVVYLYVVIEHYITPAFSIPYYYIKVREQRLSVTV